MRNQSAIFEDGEDFLGERGKVICITFVGHDSIFEVNRYDVILLHRIDPVLKLDHGKAVVDCVSKEDTGEGFGDSYPSPTQGIT